MKSIPIKLTTKNIFVAVPSLGQIRSETMASLMKLQFHLHELGVGMLIQQYHSADIATSRNTLASNFFWLKQFSHLLFVDSDMSFEPEAVQRLLDFDEPVTAQICPKRTLDLERLRMLIEKELARPKQTQIPTQTLIARAADYAVRVRNWDGSTGHRIERGGFLSVPGIGAAIMLVRRDALETMALQGAAISVGSSEAKPGGHRRTVFGFFSPLSDEATGCPLAEDLSFCKRWVVECAGQIWADTETPINHHGSWAYSGRYADLRSEISIPRRGDLPTPVGQPERNEVHAGSRVAAH